MGNCFAKNKDSETGYKGYTAQGRGIDSHYQAPPQPVSHYPKPSTQQLFPNIPQKPGAATHQPGMPSTQAPSPRPAQKLDTNIILGKPFEDVRSHYSLGKELGRGQFGVTYLCTEIATGKKYACKSISKRKLVTKSDKDDMNREIQIMQHLSGQPNIVEFKGAYEDKQSVHLVMELCEGGELFDRIIAKVITVNGLQLQFAGKL